MSDTIRSPRSRPSASESSTAAHDAPHQISPPRAFDLLLDRVRGNFPFVLLGGAFLAGAWAASLYHVRVLASPYPLWIVLALNGIVAAVAGTAGMFTSDPELPIGERLDLVHVPRTEWESMVHRLKGIPSPSRAPSFGTAPAPLLRIRRPVPFSSVVARRPSVPPVAQIPVPVAAPPSEGPDLSALQREMGLFELRGIAEGALSTGEHLGSEQLRALLAVSSDDLTHISKLLGSPRQAGETSSALLIRLLRRPTARDGIATGQFTASDADRLATKLSEIIRAPTRTRKAGPSSADLRAVTDEFDALLEELEPRREPPTKKP